jgi:CheY-like chemotaxis protein
MSSTAPRHRKNILVIEDSLATREGLVLAVEMAGHDALAAADGQEALRVLRAVAPVDLILLDLFMPIMDGWHFREEQLRDPELASIPVLVLSACANVAREAIALGVAGLLQKPVAFDDLLACIRGYASQTRPGILIVDDEVQVRTMLGLALRHHGFKVWLADGGRKAIELYARQRDAIDVVLLDVRTPGFNGLQTLAALQKINPLVRCCFISDDSVPYPRASLLALGACAVLEKPFGLVDVSHALREALAAREEPVNVAPLQTPHRVLGRSAQGESCGCPISDNKPKVIDFGVAQAEDASCAGVAVISSAAGC